MNLGGSIISSPYAKFYGGSKFVKILIFSLQITNFAGVKIYKSYSE
jgi:hypothetical protein